MFLHAQRAKGLLTATRHYLLRHGPSLLPLTERGVGQGGVNCMGGAHRPHPPDRLRSTPIIRRVKLGNQLHSPGQPGSGLKSSLRPGPSPGPPGIPSKNLNVSRRYNKLFWLPGWRNG